ncbi:MAG: thiamine-phosphate kinase [bacterium]
MTDFLKISGEFQLIKYIQRKVPPLQDKRVILGIGDDSAVLQEAEGKYLLVTTDMLVENVHFNCLYSSFRQIGKKALLVNISDIAAMGGEPKFALVSLALSPHLLRKDFHELIQGMVEIAGAYSILILGGDTNASYPSQNPPSDLKDLKNPPAGLIINITLLGEVSPEHLVTRRGAQKGDFILLTGQVGGSAAGLDLLHALKNPALGDSRLNPEELGGEGNIQRHRVPMVRLAESRIISQNLLATAMIDVSDGLAGDLRHLCQQAGAGAMLWIDQLPVSEETKKIAQAFHKPYLSYALSGGEDYELLFTCHPDRAREARQLIEQGTGTQVSIIGRITDKYEGIRLIDSHGHTVPAPESGFDHFQPGPEGNFG